MEIKIPKEVRDYHENIFFGLNTRQFICSVLAVGVAVGIYFALQPYVGTEEIGWMCILGAAPFAACMVELVMRIGCTMLLTLWLGYYGVCIASPLAWLGACAIVVPAYYITLRKYQ